MEAIIRARPRPPAHAGTPGTHTLKTKSAGDALLFVPAEYDAASAWPLLVSLHGAGGNPHHGLHLVQSLAIRERFLVLAPGSKSRTWDVIVGGIGPDMAGIDELLDWTFDRYHVQASRVGIGGFSDGASYAISVGVMNGDLFRCVLAFSPGFFTAKQLQGQPRIYISHGVRDPVLPIDACSRKLKPRLQRAGYAVTYREFPGEHEIPDEIRREAVRFFLGS